MNFLTKEYVWRARETLGLESTDPHKPKKEEIIAYMGQVEIAATLGAVIVKTKAELDTVTNKPDYTPAIVGADSNHALSGYYQWLGGTWHYVRDLADSITRLVEIDGTGNAIRAKLRLGVSLSAVEFAVFVPIDNNSGAVTIKVDDVLLPIRNGLGNELGPDDLQTGYPAMLAVIEGQEGYVLLNPANVEAVVLAAKAAAIAARNQAQTAQGKAEDALNQLEAAVEQASDLAFKRFNKLYLGSFDDDPDTDIEGNALEDGALYFKSPDKKLKVYSDVDGWVLATPDASDFVQAANNLSEIASAPHARQNLGLQNLAVLDKVGTAEVEDNSLTTQKYKNNSVTDQKLNSAKLNALNGLPKIVAAYSDLKGSASYRLTRSGNTFTFENEQPDTDYIVQIVGGTLIQGSLTTVDNIGIRGKTEQTFQIGGLGLRSSGGVVGATGKVDVVVYRV
ncbi:hypothetical protein PsAD13_03693 [Pseudovibrio sp. Ad13]|uniref:hypothetical protein n=1 Tax=Pseudovibrio sp. Ad13 TaxID=989396 RepID=UPI0007AE8240|nr:hypothetical protein [Pseudovibrio sp. Ad13]KZK82139.1 hypothetical protein PsAD13_03693 [Pseudovibrio sp. Ad13]